MHIEFNYRDRKKKELFGDCLDISDFNDSYWLHPINKRDVIMKISFATEELYRLAREAMHKGETNNN